MEIVECIHRVDEASGRSNVYLIIDGPSLLIIVSCIILDLFQRRNSKQTEEESLYPFSKEVLALEDN